VLLRQTERWAEILARLSVGSNRLASKAIMAITTSNSIKVKPAPQVGGRWAVGVRIEMAYAELTKIFLLGYLRPNEHVVKVCGNKKAAKASQPRTEPGGI